MIDLRPKRDLHSPSLIAKKTAVQLRQIALPFLLLLLVQPLPSHAGNVAKKLFIVTTVAPITNIVRNVSGDYANVTGIVPDGTDSHTFEPVPADARLLETADIIIANGLDLELPTLKLAEKITKGRIRILELGNRILRKEDWQYDFSFPRERGHPNPHLWPNIALAMHYVEVVQDELIALDPVHKEGYMANASMYLSKLRKLDKATFDCVKTIPEKNRKLVTYHDSFAYFAPRYGMKIIAAVQPSDFSEPGPREVIRIIKQIRNENVPAIFGSEVFPSKIMEQIARETGVKFIDQLSDDALPPPPANSFIGMMANNMRIMTAALGGNPGCMTDVDTSNIKY
ncbi:zinc/manganese transport system substrate-binding protein/manganese/iron transport system substrate-binding protein [Nitrosospira multiformis]|uniref:Zinc/manganese transport system substrate-binding protein/manganese/iron transport system substrate-binding protein n=1 Tax=Nitrosospira multiformis TaxID=1231 RepID=A0A1H8BNV5_9PROT|nr:zinc/manganese transport system substrate-binding protein/manganese/iron transport system substrate-binding protein [Nitrosospira multiformis]